MKNLLAVCALMVGLLGCAGSQGVTPTKHDPVLVTFQTEMGLLVKAPGNFRNSAQLVKALYEIDVAVRAFLDRDISLDPSFTIDPPRGSSLAVYEGDGRILLGFVDPPYFPGLPETLGALAHDEKELIPLARITIAVVEAKARVQAIYTRETTSDD